MKWNIIRTFIKQIIYSYTEKPKHIQLDLCSMCQLKCVKCPMDNPPTRRQLFGWGYLKFEDFKNFVDKNKYIKSIETSRMGEIFLNPDLDKIIKYAFDKKIELTAGNGVNLNYLKEETAENLVKYKFKRLTISIDGATPETYAIYRRGGDFNKVIENIKLINKGQGSVQQYIS